MKKILRITLKALGILVAIALIVGVIGYLYVSNTFLSFEDDYAENKNLKELTLADNTFIDRNGNGALDVYEDDRNPIEMRVADV